MRWLLILLATCFVWSNPAKACSAVEGYRIPTNFELVQQAKVIVLARVVSVPATFGSTGSKPQDQTVIIEPIRFLKGSAPAESLALIGWRAPENWDGLPTATTLFQSHFSTGLGACIRQFYTPGELVVAMFTDDPDMVKFTGRAFNQIAHPWARAVETVESPNDIWVQAVDRYVSLQAGAPETLPPRIRSAFAELRGTSTVQAQAIAADLESQLTHKDPGNTWGSFALPTGTSAGVHGQKGVGLQCLAGTAPTMTLEVGSPVKVELVVDGKPHAAQLALPTQAEKLMFESPFAKLASESAPAPRPSLYRFVDAPQLFAALRTASGEVQVKADGKVVVGGRPLDALYRWAGHCEKLQSRPAPVK